MNNQQLNIKNSLKCELMESFENIQFEIDTHAQQIPTSLTNDDEKRRQYVLSKNEEMVKVVQEVLKSNVNRINEYEFDTNSQNVCKESLKRNILDNYCFYAKYEFHDITLMSLGFLLVTDWYLDSNQLLYLRSKFRTCQHDHDANILYLNSDILILYHKLFKNYYRSLYNYNELILILKKKASIEELNQIDEFNFRHCDFICLNFKLQKCFFEHLSKLKKLELTSFYDGKMTNLNADDDAFNCLSNLESLCLNYNITSCQLLSCLCSQMLSLKYLSLSGLITHFNSETLRNLKQLEELKIVVFNKQVLDNVFDRLEKLNHMYLTSYLSFNLTRKCFSGLINLKLLSIEAKNLYIENNTLEDLKNLELLIIKVKRLSSLNDSLFKNLTNLETLHIDACNITKNKSIMINDDAFANLKNLKLLLIKIGCFSNLNTSLFKNLINLEVLRLEFSCPNGILKNETFANQINLEELTIKINGLKVIEDKAFKGLANLKQLNIKSIKLEKITRNILSGFDNLEKLTINDMCNKKDINLIIEEDSFQSLSNLKNLTFYANNLPSLNKNLFKSLKNLEIIKIHVETIGLVHKNTFRHLDSLKFLSIRKLKFQWQVLHNESAIVGIKRNLGFQEHLKVDLFLRDDLPGLMLLNQLDI